MVGTIGVCEPPGRPRYGWKAGAPVILSVMSGISGISISSCDGLSGRVGGAEDGNWPNVGVIGIRPASDPALSLAPDGCCTARRAVGSVGVGGIGELMETIELVLVLFLHNFLMPFTLTTVERFDTASDPWVESVEKRLALESVVLVIVSLLEPLSQ